MFSDENHALGAAIAGHGVALVDTGTITAELQAGLLVQPFGPALPGQAYYLVYPETRRGDAVIETLRQWISAQE